MLVACIAISLALAVGMYDAEQKIVSKSGLHKIHFNFSNRQTK